MSITQEIQNKIKKIPKGEPFTTSRFLDLGSRSAVDKALSRLVKEGFVERVVRGVFFRPRISRFVGKVSPEMSRVVEVIAKGRCETVQVHGAEAARRFKLTTQMPMQPVYNTSGTSREISVGNLKAKLIHTSDPRKLQLAGKKAGLALTALWYLGKEQVNAETIQIVRKGLSEQDFKQLMTASKPAWMTEAINSFRESSMRA